MQSIWTSPNFCCLVKTYCCFINRLKILSTLKILKFCHIVNRLKCAVDSRHYFSHIWTHQKIGHRSRGNKTDYENDEIDYKLP